MVDVPPGVWPVNSSLPERSTVAFLYTTAYLKDKKIVTIVFFRKREFEGSASAAVYCKRSMTAAEAVRLHNEYD